MQCQNLLCISFCFCKSSTNTVGAKDQIAKYSKLPGKNDVHSAEQQLSEPTKRGPRKDHGHLKLTDECEEPRPGLLVGNSYSKLLIFKKKWMQAIDE